MPSGVKDRDVEVRPIEVETDTALLQAALATFQHLEFQGQLRAILSHVAGWTGGSMGFALSAAEHRRKLALAASTLPKADARHRAFAELEQDHLRKFCPSGVEVFDGLGPLASQLVEWPDPAPTATALWPVLDARESWRGVLVLMLDARPEAAALQRSTKLLDIVAPAVSHAMHLQAMRELVIKDDTAHCYNRRYFEEFLPEELARASRFRSPLSLIFLDMDNLKQVNNAHGHAMGSQTLTEVSGRIRRKIRKFDKLFRFGGDEFCILLPETEWHGAVEVAERVREEIASKPFLVAELESLEGVSMTASMGIAAYPLHARTQQDLIQQADRAMQKVKGGTKNSIAVAEVAGSPGGDGGESAT